MFYFGLLLAVCYIPGLVGSFIPTQWVALSCLLPIALWRNGGFPPAAWLGIATLTYAAISIMWAPDRWDAGFGLWLACIWALAFWFGCTAPDPRRLWQGLAVGIWVSSAVAIFQYLGYHPVLGEGISGLFFNSTLLGASACLVIIALITQHQWFYIPGCLPALILSGSRGAFIVLILTLATRYIRLRYVLCAGALAAMACIAVISYLPTNTDILRLTIWGAAFQRLTFWGNGIGSFATYFIRTPTEILYPGRVHNDYLQLWFELGPAAIAIYILGFVALRQRGNSNWSILFAIAVYALFYFPLYAPIPAFLAFFTAGALLRQRHDDWIARVTGRYVSVPRYTPRQSNLDLGGGQALPTPSAN